MKKGIILIVVLTGMMISSCGNRKVLNEYHSFDGYSWSRGDDIIFICEIEDEEAEYDFDVKVRHMSGFSYEELVVVFRIISPSGSVRSKEHRIRIIDEEGNYLGDGMGDIWDLTFPLLERVTLAEAGTYHLEFNNVMPRVRVSGLMELGLEVTKSSDDRDIR